MLADGQIIIRCSSFWYERFGPVYHRSFQDGLFIPQIVERVSDWIKIDAIVRIFGKDSNKITKMLLAKELQKLQQRTNECTNASRKMQTTFEQWNDYTSALASAVSSQKGKL